MAGSSIPHNYQTFNASMAQAGWNQLHNLMEESRQRDDNISIYCARHNRS